VTHVKWLGAQWEFSVVICSRDFGGSAVQFGRRTAARQSNFAFSVATRNPEIHLQTTCFVR
jgi:hypothetical protein